MPTRLRAVLQTSEGLLALVSILLLTISAVLAVDPTLVPPTIRGRITPIESGRSAWQFTVAVGSLLGIYALWRLIRSAGSTTPAMDPDSLAPSDRPTVADDLTIVGADRTATIEALIDAYTHDRGWAADRDARTAAVKDQLTTIGHTVLTGRGMDADTATATIERGDWTDDPVAAAFLGTDAAPDFPLVHRLLGWLVPGYALERRIEHAVTALEAIAEGEDG